MLYRNDDIDFEGMKEKKKKKKQSKKHRRRYIMKIAVNYSDVQWCHFVAVHFSTVYVNLSRAVTSCIDCRNASNVSLPNLIKTNRNGVAWHHADVYGTLNIDDREAMQFVLQSFNQLSPICISSDRHIYNGVQASKFVHRISVWDSTTRQAQTNKQNI